MLQIKRKQGEPWTEALEDSFIRDWNKVRNDRPDENNRRSKSKFTVNRIAKMYGLTPNAARQKAFSLRKERQALNTAQTTKRGVPKSRQPGPTALEIKLVLENWQKPEFKRDGAALMRFVNSKTGMNRSTDKAAKFIRGIVKREAGKDFPGRRGE